MIKVVASSATIACLLVLGGCTERETREETTLHEVITLQGTVGAEPIQLQMQRDQVSETDGETRTRLQPPPMIAQGLDLTSMLAGGGGAGLATGLLAYFLGKRRKKTEASDS